MKYRHLARVVGASALTLGASHATVAHGSAPLARAQDERAATVPTVRGALVARTAREGEPAARRDMNLDVGAPGGG